MADATLPTAERWLPIPGWEGAYDVSNLGRVRSLARKVIGRDGVARTKAGCPIKPMPGTHGYPVVHLGRNPRRARTVHSLVMEAFVGPRPDGLQVRHLDGDRTNPALTNLAYGTPSQNARDMRRHGIDANLNKRRCPQGHAYTPENTYVTPKRPNARYCRTCHAAHSRAHKDRLRRVS